MADRRMTRICRLQVSPGIYREFARGELIASADEHAKHWFVLDNSAEVPSAVAAPIAPAPEKAEIPLAQAEPAAENTEPKPARAASKS